MNAFDEALHRIAARRLGRALPVRQASALAPDPELTIGIATIKIVTEEQVQAIAFGPIGTDPRIIVRLDPIGRDVRDLLPFAEFLNGVAERAIAADGALRIWTPHAVALEALDVLGHRYWRNQTASDEIRRMGEICRIIAHEFTFPGQQIVADAAAILREHMITGLTPVEEGHLHALLVWLDPTIRDPLEAARERIRVPASGVLPNTPDVPLDDRIDRLRRDAKGASGRHRRQLQDRISTILSDAVRREWDMMIEARAAFQALALPATGLGKLSTDSQRRILYSLGNGHYPARSPERLTIQLGQMEVGQDQANRAAVEADPIVREQARRAGGVVSGTVAEVDQPQRGRNPCNIVVTSTQRVVRFRRDDKVKVLGSNVCGVVRRIDADPSGGIRVAIEIKSGVRTTNVLTVGVDVELAQEGFGHVNTRALIEARDRQAWAFYADTMPAIPGMALPNRSALAIADDRRRS